MGNLTDALLQLREERKEMQVQVEKLDQAIHSRIRFFLRQQAAQFRQCPDVIC